VGTTDTDLGFTDGDDGVVFSPSGYIQAARDSAFASLYLNKLNNDGSLINFAKDGSTVGSIGTKGGDLYIGTGVVGIRTHDSTNSIRPTNTNDGTARDAAIDLGASNVRFKDLYLSGGAYLGGTGSANKLDDYEEGTWTPSTTGLTGVNIGTATYTKVGRLVSIDLRINWTGSDQTNNALSFSLPFTSATQTDSSRTGLVFYSGTSLLSGAAISSHVSNAASSISFYKTDGGNFTQVSRNTVNGSYDWLLSMSYFAA
jgi:hypothetical protein